MGCPTVGFQSRTSGLCKQKITRIQQQTKPSHAASMQSKDR